MEFKQGQGVTVISGAHKGTAGKVVSVAGEGEAATVKLELTAKVLFGEKAAHQDDKGAPEVIQFNAYKLETV